MHMFMTYFLTNFFSKNKTFYFFGAVDIFFISAQHMLSNRNFGVKQIFWADEFQADEHFITVCCGIDVHRGERGTSCTPMYVDFKNSVLKTAIKVIPPPHIFSQPKVSPELYWKQLCCAITGEAGGWINQWNGVDT